MTPHICQLNESNGFACDECDRKRERAVMEFDRDYLPKLRTLMSDMGLPVATRDRIQEDCLDAFIEAAFEEN